MKLIKRYNVELKAWEVGYWINNTRFVVVDLVSEMSDLKLYEEAA